VSEVVFERRGSWVILSSLSGCISECSDEFSLCNLGDPGDLGDIGDFDDLVDAGESIDILDMVEMFEDFDPNNHEELETNDPDTFEPFEETNPFAVTVVIFAAASPDRGK